MNELMESQETIQRYARLLNLIFDSAKNGQGITIICRSDVEQQELFYRAKGLFETQRIRFSQGLDENNSLYLQLGSEEKVILSLPPTIVSAVVSEEAIKYNSSVPNSVTAPFEDLNIIGPKSPPVVMTLRPDAPIFRSTPNNAEEFETEENKLLVALTELRANKPGNGSRPTAKPSALQPSDDVAHPLMQSVGQILNTTRPTEEVLRNRSALDDLAGSLDATPANELMIEGAITSTRLTTPKNHPNNKKRN